MNAGHPQNADQIAYWNGPGGQRWASRQAAQDIVLQPVLDLLIDRAAPKAGERVVDVGCGYGPIAVTLARRLAAADAAIAIVVEVFRNGQASLLDEEAKKDESAS